MSAHQYDEGHTVAGWTGFGIASVGTTVWGLGLCLVSVPLLAAGIAIDVVGLLATWALHLTGWGKPPGRRPREQWGMRVRDTAARAGHPGCVGCRLAGRGVARTAVDTAPAQAPEAEREAAAASGVMPVSAGEAEPAAAPFGG
ncbi:HGxxPAAW family protein [Streptomyces sp. NPDC050287]|uniref:HGxxPAAW family protein n=1 Tax=Streptomyces sp. NPDC050287 TaxID=3365608 RepID=UPI0037943454